MGIGKFLARAIAPAVVLLPMVSSVFAADAGDYAPENIEKTHRRLDWICMVRPLCPVTDDVRGVIKRALGNDRSAGYLLGLTLMTGDGLPSDRDAGLAWIVRAAEFGDPAAARDIAGRLRNGASIKVDETRIATALKPDADAGEVEAMRALAPMIIRGRGIKSDPAQGLAMLTRAAEKGSSGAEQDLSQLYLDGAPGVPADRAEVARCVGAPRQCRCDGVTRLHVDEYADRRILERA
jgi:hypothetical protein